MSEVQRRRGRPPRPVPVDDIQVQEAICAHYEERLEQAYARLGELVEARERRQKTLRLVIKPES
jgi:hypothetical protein